MAATHTVFDGTIADRYDGILGPMWFDPYARDLAARLPVTPGMRVLEVACGTGIATRRIRDRLAPDAALVAIDLNLPMLGKARPKVGAHEHAAWAQADAGRLPLRDRSFDLVVCQFGLMLFPDRRAAVREARRVLRPGGLFVFSTWDSLAHNDLARMAHEACAEALPPAAPPQFWGVPYGLHDEDALRDLVASEGLTEIRIDRVQMPSTAPSAELAAVGMIEGTPCVLELRARRPDLVAPVTGALARRVAERHGSAPVRASMRALVCSARRP